MARFLVLRAGFGRDHGIRDHPAPVVVSYKFTGALAFFVLFGILVVGGVATVWFVVLRGFWRIAAQNRWNAQQPVVSAPARVVAKRNAVSGGGENYSASTTYYATFETPDGERRELRVSGVAFGQLAEGDRGTLSSQGTAYRGFERQRVIPR